MEWIAYCPCERRSSSVFSRGSPRIFPLPRFAAALFWRTRGGGGVGRWVSPGAVLPLWCAVSPLVVCFPPRCVGAVPPCGLSTPRVALLSWDHLASFRASPRQTWAGSSPAAAGAPQLHASALQQRRRLTHRPANVTPTPNKSLSTPTTTQTTQKTTTTITYYVHVRNKIITITREKTSVPMALKPFISSLYYLKSTPHALHSW